MSYPFTVTVTGGNIPFEKKFKSQLNAEIYKYSLESSVYNSNKYTITTDFILKYSKDGILAEVERHKKLSAEAERLQRQCVERTSNNLKNPKYNPCEVCGSLHENYNCCDQCNYNTHTCHSCGDNLGHKEVSMCYILEGLGE